jgi:hypothetical protein
VAVKGREGITRWDSFKVKVALAAVKGDKTLAKNLAKDFEIHTTQVSEWKQLLLDSATRRRRSRRDPILR